MNKQYGWVSEYKRKKFFERQKLRREKELLKSFDTNSDFEIPKTIAVMLDLDGTCDFINDEKAKKFIAQLDILRKKFGAKISTISISTHYDNSDRMQEVLEILSRNLSSCIKVGISFFYGGIYDYDKREEIPQEYSFNRDKVKTFDSYYVNSIGVNNQWFAIIDDSISDDTYSKYKNSHPMLVCRPSQNDEDSISKNNFMSIATTTKGIDGVIETLESYIESIRFLSPIQVIETQRNMITHLSCWDLTEKIRNRDYAFLERYFREGFADEADYRDSLNWLIWTNSDQISSKDELVYLREIFGLMSQHFQERKEEENIDKVLKLQKTFESNNKIVSQIK